MNEEIEKNSKEMLINIFNKELETYELETEEKNFFLDMFVQTAGEVEGDITEEEIYLVIKPMLETVVNRFKFAKQSISLIGEYDNLDNKFTKLKSFKRKLLKGETATECLSSVKSWFELFNSNDFPNRFTEHLDELLGKDAEEIVSLANRHRMDFPGGKNKFRTLLTEFKEQDYRADTKYFSLQSFLIELASKTKNWSTPRTVQVETAHHYFNAKELIRMAEEDFAKEESTAKIAKYFFELGALYQGVMFAGHMSDERVINPLTDRMRSEICSSNQKKEAKIKFDTHLGYALDAWNAGCKLLHKQMGILLWVGVDNKSSSLKLLYEDIKRAAKPKFVQGGHESVGREELVCPCPTGEHSKCPMIKILPPGSYFNVKGTHKSEAFLKDCCLEFNSYREAKKAPLVPGECQD